MTTLTQYRIALQIFQSNRLRRDYSDLAEIPQYDLVGEFFFSEMYGPRDFTARDAGARRLQHILQMLPGVHVRDVEVVLELLDLTNRLDGGLARLMFRHNTGTDFDEATYDYFYRLADNYDDRLTQLKLVDTSLYNVFRLSRSQLLGIGLHRSRLVAKLAGIEVAHDFLVKGYDAVRNVTDIDHFAQTVYTRELARLDRIYER
ncbi:FFLEELY motif protein [Candidatus Chloroploca asiatica]|uniref:DUF8198 domain-containing protein n=1 Tax=Candidatus Chloroploca asiatica TaxID=1506545 RepID=A0A2H3KPU1_9CHLR|nr:hypothetical protein [Candidatus Chloroploca asiatica]PDW00313.1 hypothetical protein A9Q02_09955 [Candidatus Chloroploca asiatica]